MKFLKYASIHRFDPETGLLTGTKDGNLVNIFLRLFGKCSEKALCIRLLIFQVDLKCTLAADYYCTMLQTCFLTSEDLVNWLCFYYLVMLQRSHNYSHLQNSYSEQVISSFLTARE